MPLVANREPDLVGPNGRAWRSRVGDRTPDHSACLAVWVLDRPGAHPAWSTWVVSACHLRPIAGVRPAVLHYPEAEYELQVAAVDPRPDVGPDEPMPFMMLLDLVHQFHGVTDREAVRLVHLYVEAVVSRGASPDSDFRTWWKRTIDAKVEQLRAARTGAPS